EKAIESLRQLARDTKYPLDGRSQAIRTLVSAKAANTSQLLRQIAMDVFEESPLRGDAIRGLASFDDENTPYALLQNYGSYTPELGRAVFAKTCQQCHTLFGAGGKVGPDITGSQRANLDYLLSNVLDPSAVMAKEYQPTVVRTADGRIVTGLLKEETAAAISLQTQNELVVISKGDIDEM